MVVYLPAILQWNLTPSGGRTVPNDLLRCFRVLGMWCQLEQPMVPDTLAGRVDGNAHIPKGTVPHSDCNGCVGPKLGGGQCVCCYCDNIAVVYAINKGTARDPQMMRLIHTLFFFCATYRVTISARYIPGVRNTAADALSRANLPLFFTLNPQAAPLPSVIPDVLQQLVLNRKLLWTSPSWIKLFTSTLATVSPLLREPLTHQHSFASCLSATPQR